MDVYVVQYLVISRLLKLEVSGGQWSRPLCLDPTRSRLIGGVFSPVATDWLLLQQSTGWDILFPVEITPSIVPSVPPLAPWPVCRVSRV